MDILTAGPKKNLTIYTGGFQVYVSQRFLGGFALPHIIEPQNTVSTTLGLTKYPSQPDKIMTCSIRDCITMLTAQGHIKIKTLNPKSYLSRLLSEPQPNINHRTPHRHTRGSKTISTGQDPIWTENHQTRHRHAHMNHRCMYILHIH